MAVLPMRQILTGLVLLLFIRLGVGAGGSASGAAIVTLAPLVVAAFVRWVLLPDQALTAS